MVDAGLPNITGQCPSATSDNNGSNIDALISSRGIHTAASGSGSGIYGGVLTFDASKSNDVYGNSSTVQPPAVTMLYLIKY